MKIVINFKAFFILLLISPMVFGEIYPYKILRIIDGDTIIVEAPFLPKPLKPQMPLRIQSIDTPEKSHYRAKCSSEIELGIKATEFLKTLINQGKDIKIQIIGEDKFGRLLGDVIIDGQFVSDLMKKAKYAKSYYGAKKPDWCNLNEQ